jgi:serine/threonine protein kinase
VRELSDRALEHLRDVAAWPDVSGTRYELRGELARGGMGVVYLARDRELDRDVALKVVAAEPADPRATARLRREARISARLEHPGIVPVHDVGSLPDGRVFYAMKLVSGRRLDDLVRDGVALRERLRLLLRICEPVAFAHAHGVIHRDLKPENVMVGRFGEVLVMDWGVARHREERGRSDHEGGASDPLPAEPDPSLTAHGTVLGTPAYMAPEQARGEVERVDARADVYALGAILYFMLTGHPPGRQPASPDASTKTRPHGARPVRLLPPRDITPEVPRPLEAVCLKALADDPAHRYGGVADLAADLARFLEGEPVAAFPEGLARRAVRLARRYQAAILLVLAYLVMRVVLLLVARI